MREIKAESVKHVVVGEPDEWPHDILGPLVLEPRVAGASLIALQKLRTQRAGYPGVGF